MDSALTPPLRVQPLRVEAISLEAAQTRIETFLDDLRSRNLAKTSGETTTSVQLQKLDDALREEIARRSR